jgi:NAD-dependent DNA ligase
MHFISLPKQEENVLFQGKIFYVLGFDNDKAKDIKMVIESFGGTVTHNLTSETTYVVTTPQESKKNSMSIREAIDFGVPVVSESFIWQATVTRSSAGNL